VFTTRLSKALAELEAELAATRTRHARSERLEALGTLAAGAAHELASPLSTIAVAARDLELALTRDDPLGEPAEDARLIRQEVSRCRAILDLMASDAGQSTGDSLVPSSVDELLDQALSDLKGRDRVMVEVEPACRGEELIIPRRALALAVRQIVKNALDASKERGPVRIRVSRTAGELHLTVVDRGSGMTPRTLSRASEPFFTTKEPGQGMGLGLFLSQTVVARLEGRIDFESSENEGTSVRVTLPFDKLKRVDAP
jgi:two-component system sensor histidine kinase RegB